jgi:O-Antigen ligase
MPPVALLTRHHSPAIPSPRMPPGQTPTSAPVAAEPPLVADLKTSDGCFRRWLVFSLAGFLAGYQVMPNQWIQLAWLGFGLWQAFRAGRPQTLWQEARGDAFMRSAALFLAFMIVRSMPALLGDLPIRALEVLNWLLGTAVLVIFALLSWSVARVPQALMRCAFWSGMAAALAATVSLALFFFASSDFLSGGRLMNWFVYGGLNPVVTGLFFGFAAAWLACLISENSAHPKRTLFIAAHALLVAAVFYTASRGALLALAAAHGVLLMTRGWRRTRMPLLTLVLVVGTLQVSAPLMTAITHSLQRNVGSLQPGVPVLAPNPVQQLIDRKDSGRLNIYRAGLAGLETPWEVAFGLGQWGTDERWGKRLPSQPDHLHSVFLATLVHGGVIGLVLLGVVLWRGCRNVLRLVNSGQETWLTLFVFGCCGLTFDGQTLTTALSTPRMEPLLFWFPLVVAASLAAQPNCGVASREDSA